MRSPTDIYTIETEHIVLQEVLISSSIFSLTIKFRSIKHQGFSGLPRDFGDLVAWLRARPLASEESRKFLANKSIRLA